MKDVKDILKLHQDNYKNIIKDTIHNNTNALVDEDITSILKRPPLDSMDLIRNKLISLAKKNKVILNTDNLKDILDEYRDRVMECLIIIKKLRNNGLSSIIDKHKFVKDTDVIRVNKKDFNDLNKNIKNILKEAFSSSCEQILVKKIDMVFSDDVAEDTKKKIVDDFIKFMKIKYQKQILENIDIKVLIKDTTLLNIVKEQGERYLFTLSNSRLLNDIK